MIVCDLRVLRRICVVALFMCLRGTPMCFSCFVVVLGSFVVVVFWHDGSLLLLSISLAPILAAPAMLVASGASYTANDTVYQTEDNLGSTQAVTDAMGNIVSRSDYLPFGETIRRDGDVSSGISFWCTDRRKGHRS